MSFKFILGIDISKPHLDLTLLDDGVKMKYFRISNNPSEIKKCLIDLLADYQLEPEQMLVVMEFTGTYNDHLIEVLEDLQIPLWQCSSVHIIRSSGIQRGKNDKIDSFRIAMFAFRNIDRYKPHIPMRKEVKEIKRLFAVRRNLVKAKKQIQALTMDYDFVSPQAALTEKKSILNSIDAIDIQINVVEEKIKNRILNDPHLSRYYIIITSIKGVSFVTTVKILITTNEFQKFTNPKALACHAGIAPFDHTSGSSIKKQTKVSSLADKELKSLLHMAALAAITHPGELKDYFDRKLAQGKHKMNIINNVRNKIVHRIFSCIKNNRIYVKNFNNYLAET